jgi:hypothetical protein
MLQPKVVLSDDILHGALVVLQRFAYLRPDAADALRSSNIHLASFAAASLWLAAKMCGVRTGAHLAHPPAYAAACPPARCSLPHRTPLTRCLLPPSPPPVEIPNRTLMSQATCIHPQALTDFELDLCTSLDWDIASVLRAHALLH